MLYGGGLVSGGVVEDEVHVEVGRARWRRWHPGSGHPLYGITETGSAVILGMTGGTAAFGRFVFCHHPEYGEALATYTQYIDGQGWLQIDRDRKHAAHYLDCIPSAVEELLKLEGLDCSEIGAVFPPYLSLVDRTELAARLGIPTSRFVDFAADTEPLLLFFAVRAGARLAAQSGE
jgi:hypothetical protein